MWLPPPPAAQAHQLCSRALHLSPCPPLPQELPLPCRALCAACSPSQPPELREGLLEVVSGTWGQGTEQELSRWEGGGAQVCYPRVRASGILRPPAPTGAQAPGSWLGRWPPGLTSAPPPSPACPATLPASVTPASPDTAGSLSQAWRSMGSSQGLNRVPGTSQCHRGPQTPHSRGKLRHEAGTQPREAGSGPASVSPSVSAAGDPAGQETLRHSRSHAATGQPSRRLSA